MGRTGLLFFFLLFVSMAVSDAHAFGRRGLLFGRAAFFGGMFRACRRVFLRPAFRPVRAFPIQPQFQDQSPVPGVINIPGGAFGGGAQIQLADRVNGNGVGSNVADLGTPVSNPIPNPVNNSGQLPPPSEGGVVKNTANGMIVERPEGSNRLFVQPDGQVAEQVNGQLRPASSGVTNQLVNLYADWKNRLPESFPALAQAVLNAAGRSSSSSSASTSNAPTATNAATPLPNPRAKPSVSDAPTSGGSHAVSDSTIPPDSEKAEKERPSAPLGEGGLVCSDPKKAICDSAKAQYSGELSPSNLRKELFAETTKAMGREPDRTLLFDENPTEWTAFLLGMRKVLAQRGGGTQTLSEFQRVRGVLQNSIANDPNLRSVARSSAGQLGMIDSLQNARLANLFEEVLAGRESLARFRTNCGADGFAYGAFYRSPDNVLYLCPVYFLGSPERVDLQYTIGHELGHSVDSERYRTAYQNLLACYAGDRFAEFNQGSQKHEVVADYHAFNAFVETLPTGNPQAALAAAGRHMGNYCTGSGDPNIAESETVKQRRKNVFAPGGVRVHADHDFRIGVMLGRHPRFREAVGCPAVSANMPACNNGGLVSRATVLAKGSEGHRFR